MINKLYRVTWDNGFCCQVKSHSYNICNTIHIVSMQLRSNKKVNNNANIANTISAVK